MPTPQQVLLSKLKTYVDEIPERFPGYRAELLVTLAEMVELQKTKPAAHKQKVQGKMEALGTAITQATNAGAVAPSGTQEGGTATQGEVGQ